MIVFQAFEHPSLKLFFQYPNTYTLWPPNIYYPSTVSVELGLGLPNIF